MNTATLYGIKNCDTVKKARRWLESRNIDYRFHDFRADGLEVGLVDQWLAQTSWETLLNKRGTTWRKLPVHTQDSVNGTTIVSLLVEQPTLIKRPVLTLGDTILVGFNDTKYSALFKEHQ